MPQRILVILGHPCGTSFCSALADAYIHSANLAGHQVRVLPLRDLSFDPVLHHGYTQIQALEPDLLSAQSDILWATHLAFVFPIWWGGYPGVIERVHRPYFPTRLCL